ncbi:MAG TPA: pyruvate, water dikinase [Desulfonatronum sp.]|nr:pyruvate, water dikinase [Desulfonatronum sp.]
MRSLLLRLKCFFSRKSPGEEETSELVRELFKTKYNSFKLLLESNNQALRVMSEMETALTGMHSFGMVFVRSRCTAVTVDVYSMVKHLRELADGGYADLETVFTSIRTHIRRILEHRQAVVVKDMVLPLESVDKEMADAVGGKMANLGEILHLFPELRIPSGFVVTTAGYDRFMVANKLQVEIDRRLQATEVEDASTLYRVSSEIQLLIINAQVPEDLEQAIRNGYGALEARIGKGVRVSVRSSAVGEDAAGSSFAGQYRSELNVSPENLLTVYKEILASKYSVTAISYRLNRGMRDEDVPMCVGCMAMIDAVAGGVVYSRDPTDIRVDALFINAMPGLPKAVVDGSISPDLWVVSRKDPSTILRREIRQKNEKFVCLAEEGVVRKALHSGEGGLPSLDDDMVSEVAKTALMLEKGFQTPVDVEWVLDQNGRLLIVQCRPLQQMAPSLRKQCFVTADIKGEDAFLLRDGDTASPGVAAGEVFLVRNNEDMLRFPQGAVLVAMQALPRWATLLPRTAAVITEVGGITGHLANVAREFGVPALFNVPDAMKKLSAGKVITVDADMRTVYSGRAEHVLADQVPRRGLMDGTPVHETLQEVMEYVTPLYLTDPDSPDFKVRNCRTLHDITRFCHEMSVREMFSFGQKTALARRASKRLVVDVPMQWWVLDLEDGFREPVDGPFVHITNIQSLPMQALWAGITALHWEGPPPMDGKGFMSVMLEAASNPNLSTAGPSAYAQRNYFMISKYFCNLTSRMGFHFSTVETLVGDLAYENYARFSFKGGAADIRRRTMRTKFIGGLLEEHGFSVETHEDALFARVGGLDQDSLLQRLKILGYLTIHTRQLDMIMRNPDKVCYYRDKLCRDIIGMMETPLSSV